MKHSKSIATFIAISLIGIGIQTPVRSYAAQNAAPAAAAQDDGAKMKALIDDFYKARDAKDWGKCLEIAEQCKTLGDAGFDISRQMKFSVFMRSGDERHVDQFISGLMNEAVDNANSYISFYKDDPKGMEMVEKIMQSLQNQMTELKLTKLKTLMASNQPDAYLTYAKSIMSGPDQNNARLLNYMAWYIVSPDSDTKAETELYRLTANGQPMMVMNSGTPVPFPIYDTMKHPASFKTKAMYDFALSASEKAIKLSGALEGDLKTNKNAGTLSNYLDTLGWAYYRVGNKEKAYQTEMRAGAVKSEFKTVAEWFKK